MKWRRGGDDMVIKTMKNGLKQILKSFHLVIFTKNT